MTDIVCHDCGHVRETTLEYPALGTCEECGSYAIDYANGGTAE